jgi:hypothetical protein
MSGDLERACLAIGNEMRCHQRFLAVFLQNWNLDLKWEPLKTSWHIMRMNCMMRWLVLAHPTMIWFVCWCLSLRSELFIYDICAYLCYLSRSLKKILIFRTTFKE